MDDQGRECRNADDADPPVDPVEALVAEAILRAGEEGPSAVEAICRAHPAHAAALRARLRLLEDLDLVAAGGNPHCAQGPALPVGTLSPSSGTASRAQEFGAYRILGEIGRGGQGTVVLAEDTRLGRRVALKLLSGPSLRSDSALQRFRREAELASRLDHPGICTVYESGVHEGVPFIAMRHVAGESLGGWLERAGDSRDTGHLRRAVALVARIARALHAAHEAGVVHRDVKPANVMVTAEGEPVILDFGLARAAEEGAAALTATGDVFGTPAYMSPEQIAGRPRPLDRRTDVYSLGVVLFEVATRSRPFEEPTRDGLYHAILEREPPDARTRNPAVSRDLAMVIRTALQKERHHRYATAAALASDLEAVLDGRPVSVHSVPPLSRLVRWSRRRPAQAALAAVLALGVPALAGIGGFLFARWPDLERGAAARRADDLESALEEGFRELAERRHARAVAAFDRCLEADPRCTEAAAGRMLAQLRQDRAEEALGTWERHTAAAGTRPELARLRADALRKAGRAEEAAASEPPEAPPASALEAFILGSRELEAAQGEPRAARRAYELFTRAVLQSERARALYHHGRALATKATRDPAAVRETVEVMESLWPDSLETSFYAGLAWNAVDPARAERAFRKALVRKPGDAHLHHNLGIALREQGLPAAAIEPFRTAVRIDPEYGLAHRSLALALVEVGAYEEAITSLKLALRHGASRSGWSESVQQSIAETGNLQRASGRLDALVQGSGGIGAAGAEERLALAKVAFQRSLHATSASLYRALLEAGGKDAAAQRSSAVCAAACAGCSVGEEAAALDAEARRAWREQALAWLRAELEALQARLRARTASAGEVRRELSWWRRDPHLAPFLEGGRTTAAFLAAEERAAWAALWKSVDEVLASLPAR